MKKKEVPEIFASTNPAFKNSPRNKSISRINVLELWASEYPEVERWLSKIQQKKAGAYSFYRFCEYVKKTPTELLALKTKDMTTNPPQNVVEKLLDDFCGDKAADFTNAERFNISISVKSFFKWNYCDLAKASGNVELEKVKPYNALTKEVLRKLYDRARNPRDRALVMFVSCTGIAKETLSKLKWSHLEESWERKELPCLRIESELLKGHGHGKYKGVQQITFLTPEAKRELLNYKDWLEGRMGRKLESTDNIWRSIYEPFEPLGYEVLGVTVNRMSKEAGAKFSLHDGRRWVNTALEQIGISPNWARKIRGRKVKGEEAPYSQPAIEQLRAKFREAVPLLEFTSGESKILEDRVRELEEFKAGLTPEQIEKGRHLGIIKRKEVTKPEELEKCDDGEHCQRVASEEELPELLSQGWHASIVLPSGKIVIEKA
jgi:integrase